MNIHPFRTVLTSILRATVGLLLVAGLVGCSEKKPKPAAKSAEAAVEARASAESGTPEPAMALVAPVAGQLDGAPTPAADQQVCFQCLGTGQMTCTHKGCDHGFLDCPGPCLKRSDKWEHAQIEGHGPDELWHMIHLGNGRKQPVGWGHIGEVFVVRNGQVDRLGKCQQCNGTGHLPCHTCKGKAKVTCELCEGHRVIPAAWKTNDNPVLNRQPDLLRLKDGRVFLGKRSELGERAFIRTRDGQFITVGKDDFAEPKAP
jgi:hypothetical protein